MSPATLFSNFPFWGVPRAARGTEGREEVLLRTPRVQKVPDRDADRMSRRNIDGAVRQVQRSKQRRIPGRYLPLGKALGAP